MDKNNYFHSNEAINNAKDDVYDFMPYASKIQEAIRNSCITNEQMVFGVYGKWGEGKTSFLNLIFKNLEVGSIENSKKIIKYKFNPWRYNSEDKLLFEFFNGLIKVLEHNYEAGNKKNLISKLKKYTKLLLTGTSVESEQGWNLGFKFTVKLKHSFKDTFDFWKNENKKDIETLKESIDKELAQFNYRIVIFIDDVDRLDKVEMYNVFRLVKLTASFTNITYILAFDNNLVANAIFDNFGNSPIDGHNYIEKIINVPITLPKVDYLAILNQLKKGLYLIFSKHNIVINNETPSKDQATYQDGVNRLLNEIEGIEYHIENPRMLVRLLNSFSTNIIALKSEINYSDLLWLELLKIKHHKTYNFIKNNPELFVMHAGMEFFIRSSNNYTNDLNIFLKNQNYNENDSKRINEIINVLFPIKSDDSLSFLTAKLLDSHNVKMDSDLSKTERRINHFDYFNVYFSFSNSEKVSGKMLDEFFDTLFKDPDSELSKAQFKKILENNDKSKMRYELSNRLKKIKNGTRKMTLLKLMIRNIDLLAGNEKNKHEDNFFQKSPRHELINIVFENTYSVSEDFNRELIFTFIKSPETSIMDTLYTRIGLYNKDFEDSDIQIELDRILIGKVKKEYQEKAFFNDFEGYVSRSIYSIWSKENSEEFKSYLESIFTAENMVKFIKSFPTVWTGSNGKTLDSFNEENYDFMYKVIDPNIVYKLIVKFYPEITKNKEQYDNLTFDKYDKKDDFTYLLQFAYWHNKKPPKRNLLL